MAKATEQSPHATFMSGHLGVIDRHLTVMWLSSSRATSRRAQDVVLMRLAEREIVQITVEVRLTNSLSWVVSVAFGGLTGPPVRKKG